MITKKPNKVFSWNETLTNTRFTICYGKKTFHKYVSKYTDYVFPLRDNGGICARVKIESKYLYIIGLDKIKDKNHIAYISLVAHEISHAISYYMEEYGLVDDEFRSLLISALTDEFLNFLKLHIDFKL